MRDLADRNINYICKQCKHDKRSSKDQSQCCVCDRRQTVCRCGQVRFCLVDDHITAHFVVDSDRGKYTQHIFLKIIVKSPDTIIAVAEVCHIKVRNRFVRIFCVSSVDQDLSVCIYDPDICVQISVQSAELLVDLI